MVSYLQLNDSCAYPYLIVAIVVALCLHTYKFYKFKRQPFYFHNLNFMVSVKRSILFNFVFGVTFFFVLICFIKCKYISLVFCAYKVTHSVKLNKYLKYDAYLFDRARDIRQKSLDHEI